MKVSTKGRYGLRAMIELAVNHGGAPIPINAIAERQGISLKYLHAILATLRQARLVRSVRGRAGGYQLARTPAEITVGQIIRALEGPIVVVDCVKERKGCPRSPICSSRPLWVGLSASIEELLDRSTLEALACRPAGPAERQGTG